MEEVINHFYINYSLYPILWYIMVDKAKLYILFVAYQPILGKLA